MAANPRRPNQPPRAPAARRRAAAERQPRERIIAAFMALLAEKPFEQIGFAEIAGSAGVSLAELRDDLRLDACDPGGAYEGDRPRRARRRRLPTWRRSRRASGCSTC